MSMLLFGAGCTKIRLALLEFFGGELDMAFLAANRVIVVILLVCGNSGIARPAHCCSPFCFRYCRNSMSLMRVLPGGKQPSLIQR